MNVEALFWAQLRQLVSMESQMILALPEFARAASNRSLKQVLEDHAGQSMRQKDLVRSMFGHRGVHPDGEVCLEMKSLMDCCRGELEKEEDVDSKDLLCIARVLRIKHHEIAGYEWAVALANGLGWTSESEVLSALLVEEQDVAERLVRFTAQYFAPLSEGE